MSSDINFVTFMMSSDIVVTFITTRCAMTFVFDIPVELVAWDVTVCRRLSRVFICLFGSVGSFRVRVFVIVVFVTSGKMATAVL